MMHPTHICVHCQNLACHGQACMAVTRAPLLAHMCTAVQLCLLHEPNLMPSQAILYSSDVTVDWCTYIAKCCQVHKMLHQPQACLSPPPSTGMRMYIPLASRAGTSAWGSLVPRCISATGMLTVKGVEGLQHAKDNIKNVCAATCLAFLAPNIPSRHAMENSTSLHKLLHLSGNSISLAKLKRGILHHAPYGIL